MQLSCTPVEDFLKEPDLVGERSVKSEKNRPDSGNQIEGDGADRRGETQQSRAEWVAFLDRKNASIQAVSASRSGISYLKF